MLTLADIPQIVDAGQDLVRTIQAVLDPKSPGGRKVTKAELLDIMGACGRFLVALAREMAD